VHYALETQLDDLEASSASMMVRSVAVLTISEFCLLLMHYRWGEILSSGVS